MVYTVVLDEQDLSTLRVLLDAAIKVTGLLHVQGAARLVDKLDAAIQLANSGSSTEETK